MTVWGICWQCVWVCMRVCERDWGRDGASCSIQTDSQTHDCTYIFLLTTLSKPPSNQTASITESGVWPLTGDFSFLTSPSFRILKKKHYWMTIIHVLNIYSIHKSMKCSTPEAPKVVLRRGGAFNAVGSSAKKTAGLHVKIKPQWRVAGTETSFRSGQTV